MSNPLLAERVLAIIGRGSIIRDTEVSKTVVLTLQFPWKKTPSQMQLEEYANTTIAE